MTTEDALNQIGEWIEDWGVVNDRSIGTVGSYNLACEVRKMLLDNPDIAASMLAAPPVVAVSGGNT